MDGARAWKGRGLGVGRHSSTWVWDGTVVWEGAGAWEGTLAGDRSLHLEGGRDLGQGDISM